MAETSKGAKRSKKRKIIPSTKKRNYPKQPSIEAIKTGESLVKETKKSTTVMAVSIIAIALLILLIVALIVVAVKRGFKQQQIQQEQYVQAFKMLAANQSQTNRIMLGGVTDLYGQNPTLRLAGSSTWTSAVGLPDVEITEEDEEE